MIGDVGMHLGICHRPGPQLAGHILLDGRVAFTADTDEAHRITEQDVITSTAIDPVAARLVVDGGSQNGVGQIGG
ncbi:hypothetical protein D3C80_1377950 [compost metagenome]